MTGDARDMRKGKKVKIRDAETAESIKLGWKVRRQVQQDILQKKLMQCYLKPGEGCAHIKQYPEVMHPMIEDFLRNAERQRSPWSK
jgi:hypothetical protein